MSGEQTPKMGRSSVSITMERDSQVPCSTHTTSDINNLHIYSSPSPTAARRSDNDDHDHQQHDSGDICLASEDCSSTSDDTSIRIRYLCADDVDAVKALCGELFPIEYPDCWYNDITTNSSYYSLAAVDSTRKHQVIGLLVAEARTLNQCNCEDRDILPKSFPANTRVSYILSLGVAREYRRRGIASRLLDHYLAYINCQTLMPEQSHSPSPDNSSKSSPVHQHLNSGQQNQTNNNNALIHNNDAVKAVYLHVLHSNHNALTFYQNRHFRRHRRLRDYYRIGEALQDGFTYVLYVNGGRSAYSMLQCITYLLTCALSPFRRVKRVMCAVAHSVDNTLQLNIITPNYHRRLR